MTPLKPKNDFDSPYLILKRTSSKTISRVNIPLRCNYLSKKSYGILNSIFGFSGVIDTAEPDFGDFRSDYLGEYEGIFETGLACYSGTYMGLIDEKNESRKSRDTVPLSMFKKGSRLKILSYFAKNIAN
jgi:hypothetical protein